MKNNKNNILLFIVPIYAMTKEEFETKWEKAFSIERDRVKCYTNNFEKERVCWKYNRIMALVEIRKWRDSIEFVLYKHSCGSFRFDRCPHGGFVHHEDVGRHFHILKDDTNITLKSKIINHLNTILLDEFKKGFIDFSLFETQFDMMDIYSLFKK